MIYHNIVKRGKKSLSTFWELNGSSFEQTLSSSPKYALCKIRLKLAQWFWRRRFLNFVNIFLLFRNYLLLEKGGPFICTNLNPLHPRSLVDIGPVVLEKKMKMWKVYDIDNNDGQRQTTTDDGQILIRKAHLSLRFRWAKKLKEHI